MNRDQAREIFKQIDFSFHNFNKDNDVEFIKYWLDTLEEGDYARTKFKLKEYLADSKWPPTFADILVKAPKYKSDEEAARERRAEKIVREEMKDPVKKAERDKIMKEMQEKAWKIRHGQY